MINGNATSISDKRIREELEMEIKVVKLRVVKGSKEAKSGRMVYKRIGTQE